MRDSVFTAVNKINIEAKRNPIWCFRWLLRERPDKTLVKIPGNWSNPFVMSQKGSDAYIKSVWKYMTCTFEAVFEDNHDLTCRIRETEPEPIAQQVQQPPPQRQQQRARMQQQQQPRRRRQRVRHDRRQQQGSRDAQVSVGHDILRGVGTDSRIARGIIDREISRLINLRGLLSENITRDGGLSDLFASLVRLRN